MNSTKIKQLHEGGRSISSLAEQFGVSEKEIKTVLYVTKIYNEKPQEKPLNKVDETIEFIEEFFDFNEEEEYGNDTEEDEQE